MVYVLGHPAVIGGDHRDAGLLGLMDHKGGVLGPDGRHQDGIATIEHVGYDVLVTVLTHPLDTVSGVSFEVARQSLQPIGFDTSVAPPDPQPGLPDS